MTKLLRIITPSLHRVKRQRTPQISLLKIMATNTGDRTWGHLASTEHFGRISNPQDYIEVEKENLKNDPYFNSTQASHCMIFARNDKKTFGVYNPRAAILVSRLICH